MKQLNSKPYDLDGLHKYMIDKKTKRLYETKTEKEKTPRRTPSPPPIATDVSVWQKKLG